MEDWTTLQPLVDAVRGKGSRYISRHTGLSRSRIDRFLVNPAQAKYATVRQLADFFFCKVLILQPPSLRDRGHRY